MDSERTIFSVGYSAPYDSMTRPALGVGALGGYVLGSEGMDHGLLPVVMPEKTVYEAHHVRAAELRWENDQLTAARTEAGAAGAQDVAQRLDAAIARNQKQIQVEVAQYPAGYEPWTGEVAELGGGLVMAAVGLVVAREGLKRWRRWQRAKLRRAA